MAPARVSGSRLLVTAGLALSAGLIAATLLFELTMSPPARDIVNLVAYLAATGAASLAVGWLLMTSTEADRRLTLRRKVFAITVVGGLAGLLNIFIVSQLMFLSTAHDLKVLVATLGFDVFVTAAFGSLVAASVSGRVDFVTGAVRSLSEGNYGLRLEVGGDDEIAGLARNVNQLAAQLQTAQDAQRSLEQERRELTVAVSHDLRTPLASLRAMVEALTDGIVTDEAEAKRYYTTMQREIDRLSRLVDDLFELSQIDSGAITLQRSLLPLEEIAAEVVEAMQAQARQQGIELSLARHGALPRALVDGPRIERVIANLVRNALEHTPAGGRIEVSLRDEDGWIRLDVADTGDGIAPAHLPRIWQRFYRAEASRARRGRVGDGAGLGLAIVRGFVEAHGGRVEVASEPRNGSTFTIRLPAAS
jgi:signal transduction histidine kinase